MSELWVCIDARISSGVNGGIESFVLGLARGLRSLADGNEKYAFLTTSGQDAWIRNEVMGFGEILAQPGPVMVPPLLKRGSKLFGPLQSAAKNCLRRLRPIIPPAPRCLQDRPLRVMHFTTQAGFLTNLPSIYHPHDLQHLHLPGYFTADDIRRRDYQYRTLCSAASVIAVASTYIKQDLIDKYRVDPERIAVVPLAPVNSGSIRLPVDALQNVRVRLGLPAQFALYAAQTWPHKNHELLLRAAARLRDQGLVVPIVCSGAQTEHYRFVLEPLVRELDLGRQVTFLGFISAEDLGCLYHLAHMVVIPTRFEAASFPLWEAFLAGVPAACSTVTSLPSQAGNSALLFDPNSIEEASDAMRRLWTDRALRARLVADASINVARFDWTRTARHFRALYRRLGGVGLTSEDRELLAAPPLL